MSAELCSIQGGKTKLTDDGRELYAEWIYLPTKYKQLELDALHLMPHFIHGILVLNLHQQKILEVAHPWSRNVRYSFADIVCGFQSALRERRYRRPIGLRGRYYFGSITDQLSLEMFRELIWASPKSWDGPTRQFAETDWPTLQVGQVGRGITAPCPWCDPPIRPQKDKVRWCRYHNLEISVPADPSKPITRKTWIEGIAGFPRIAT